jgi:serine/threonine protein kinase
MTPEQTRGENDRIGAQTDVWGLGVILYEMMTKKLPFVGRTSIELYHKINHVDPIPPRKLNSQVSKEVEGIILKAMSKEIEDRYPSAKAMADDIERYLDGEEVIFREPPLYLKQLRRWFRQNKWLVLVAALAILFGWLCGWYLLSKVK